MITDVCNDCRYEESSQGLWRVYCNSCKEKRGWSLDRRISLLLMQKSFTDSELEEGIAGLLKQIGPENPGNVFIFAETRKPTEPDE